MVAQFFKNFPAFYGNRRFIIVLTMHQIPSWARWIQSTFSHSN